MGLNFKYIEGQTPLNEEEKEGLLIKSVTTRGELDELEQLNIEKAIELIKGCELISTTAYHCKSYSDYDNLFESY